MNTKVKTGVIFLNLGALSLFFFLPGGNSQPCKKNEGTVAEKLLKREAIIVERMVEQRGAGNKPVPTKKGKKKKDDDPTAATAFLGRQSGWHARSTNFAPLWMRR